MVSTVSIYRKGIYLDPIFFGGRGEGDGYGHWYIALRMIHKLLWSMQNIKQKDKVLDIQDSGSKIKNSKYHSE